MNYSDRTEWPDGQPGETKINKQKFDKSTMGYKRTSITLPCYWRPLRAAGTR